MYKKPNKRPKNTNLSQFGLIDFSDPVDEDDDISLGSDDDMDLEAELAAISGGAASRRKPAKPKTAPAANLDAMIAESLKDIPSDEDVSGDEDDPDLLSELNELTIDDSEASPAPPPRASRPAPLPPSAGENHTIKLLQERITMYQAAEKNATVKGESSRARRFNRGLKTLNDMMKQAKAGRAIKEDDIPPVVATGIVSAPQPSEEEQPRPSLPEPVEPPPPPPQEEVPPPPPRRQVPPTPPEEDDARTPISGPSESDSGLQLIIKRKEEFKAAALTNKQTDKQLALELLKVAKQLDVVIDAYKNGQEMDLSELPTVDMMIDAFRNQEKEEPPAQETDEPQPSPSSEASGLISASSLEEGLKQHLAYYKEQEEKSSGNPSKQRRMGRIVKQFSAALAQAAAGRTPDLGGLPTPLGYAPLTLFVAAKSPAPAASRSAPAVPGAVSRADKQLAFLLKRQKEFRDAALTAKKNGDISQAKEYLRSAKGFDSVIDAAKGGLKVDLNSLPLPPRTKEQLEDTFDVVSADDCDPLGDDVLTTLHQQLSSQLKLCLTNRDHYRAMGNVAETNRFEHLGVTVKQDLDVITIAKRLKKEPPKFHYESRQFSVVKCNTDLNENDLELTIVRGIAYNVPNPKEVDTYVRFEFPYCNTSEESIFDKTELVKDTNSPVYNAVFPLTISRSSRRCHRVFKRYGVKFEVYSKGGWFSKDPLLGAATVKLAPLETATTIHEAYPLMDGRRPAGGSLEVRLRVRTPLAQQEFDNTTHRWLVVDN